MARFALDGIDAGDILRSNRRDLRIPSLADGARGVLRNIPHAGHAFSRQGFDLEPDPIAIFRRPDAGHFRAGVTRDH